jgi:ankyrin repeat protein
MRVWCFITALLLAVVLLVLWALPSQTNTELIYAASDGDVSRINFWIEKGAEVNSIELDGLTPLMGAIQNDKILAVRALLHAGADPNFAQGKIKPLNFAFFSGKQRSRKSC